MQARLWTRRLQLVPDDAHSKSPVRRLFSVVNTRPCEPRRRLRQRSLGFSKSGVPGVGKIGSGDNGEAHFPARRPVRHPRSAEGYC